MFDNINKKADFVLICPHLFVPFTLGECTFVRQYKQKSRFCFDLSLLIRNFHPW